MRDYLDDLGQASRAAFGALALGEAVLRRVTGPAIITGVRFPDEADVFRRAGALMVRVARLGFGPACHENGTPRVSEVAMDGYDFDATVGNDRTPNDAAVELVGLVGEHRRRPVRIFGATQVTREFL